MSTDVDVESLGPVDVAVVLIMNDEVWTGIASALEELHTSGVLRVLDLAIVRVDADGAATFLETDEAGLTEAFGWLGDDELDLLSDADLTELAAGLEPGSTALVAVWENSWAHRLAMTLRASQGALVMHERIPHHRLTAAFAALDS